MLFLIARLEQKSLTLRRILMIVLENGCVA